MKNLKALSFRGCNGPPSSASWHFPFNWMGKSSRPIALMLPSLSGLSSLTKLDVSDCGLEEGTIPTDIGSLHSLETLCLSGNNFVTLPASISGLFNLKRLELDDCKRLQSLPQLPPKLRVVEASGCSSLVTLLGALKLRMSYNLYICCADSLKLPANSGLAFSVLEEYLQAASHPSHFLDIAVPGGEIPKWFMYQNEGSSITVARPSNLSNTNKVVGYAICCVFHVPKHSAGIEVWRHLDSVDVFYSDPAHVLVCHMIGSNTSYSFHFREKFGHRGSDHLWLLYLSRQKYYEQTWLFESESNLMTLSFRAESPGLEVKRCGFHPVYMHEVEEFDQTTKQWTRFTSYNLNEFDHDFVGSNTELATTSKPSLAENAGAAEASGSRCCCEDEEPPPKRFRQLK